MGDRPKRDEGDGRPVSVAKRPSRKADREPATLSGTPVEQVGTAGVTHLAWALEARRGPMPDAAEMARYKEVDPSAPTIILEEFQRQAEHRRAMELRQVALDERVVAAEIAAEKRGAFFGLAVVLLFLAVSAYLVAAGHEVSGTILGTVDLVALATVFVIGARGGGPDDRE